MLSRRLFVDCAICAAVGLVASGAAAQPAAGVQRFVLQQMDGPVEGWMTLLVRGEIPADGVVAGHTHPGIESGYVLEGAGELLVAGKAAQRLVAGETFQMGAGVAHGLRNGGAVMKIASSYVVEKGKPLASPATI